MQTVTTIGFDIAKSVFQVHGVDAAGEVVIRRRTRHLFIRQRTAVINSIRAHLAEFGIVAPVGRKGVTELLHVVADPSDKRVPEVGRTCLATLGTQLLGLKRQILEFDRMIMAWHRSTRRASAFITFPGSVRCWRPLWSRV